METKTIKRYITVPLEEVRANNYETNIEKYGDHIDTCFICGKRIKNFQKAKQVHYLNTGEIVSHSGDDIEGSQGFFPVGNDCAKKLIIQFSF